MLHCLAVETTQRFIETPTYEVSNCAKIHDDLMIVGDLFRRLFAQPNQSTPLPAIQRQNIGRLKGMASGVIRIFHYCYAEHRFLQC